MTALFNPAQPAYLARAPVSEPRINLLHPLARGLFAAYVLNKPYTAKNLVTQNRSIILKNQTSGDGGMVDHRGMRFVATFGGSTDDHFKVDHFDIQAADVASYAVGFTANSFLTTATGGMGVIGPGLNAAGFGPHVRIRSSGGVQRLFAGLMMASSWGVWSDHASASNPPITLGESVNFSFCAENDAGNDVTDGRAFQGQQSLVMAGPGFNDAVAANSDLYLANNGYSAHSAHYSFDGHVAYYYSWKRALSDDELRAVNANPYAPFGIPLILDDAVPDMLWGSTPGGGGSTPVSDTLNARWHLRASLPGEMDSRYDIRAALTDAINSRWDVRTVMGDALDARWNMYIAAGDTLDLRFDLREVLSDTLDTRWGMGGGLNVGLSARWDIRTAVLTELDSRHDIRAAVISALDARYDLRGSLGGVLSLLWDLRAAVGETTDVRWDIRALGADTADLRWDVRGLLQGAMDARWDVRATVPDTLTGIWDLGDSVFIVSTDRVVAVSGGGRLIAVTREGRVIPLAQQSRTVSVH